MTNLSILFPLKRKGLVSILVLPLIVAALVVLRHTSAQNKPGEVSQSTETPNQKALTSAYGKLPLSFERNVGQTDDRVRFISHGDGYQLFDMWWGRM